MERLFPDPAAAAIGEQLERFSPRELAGPDRPYVYTNFAVTPDGHATIGGVSGKIGSDADTAMLMGLRESADAVMIGAGTVRAENYGRLLPDGDARERRRAAGLDPDPIAVVVSNRLDLPWDAGLFSSGAGRVIALTAADEEPPSTATPLEIVRHAGGVDLAAAMATLRREHDVAALLCEGGPHLHADLIAAGIVDELFITLGAKLAGGEGPRMVEGEIGGPHDLELRWLLREGSELFARYAVVSGE